nr:hypothetical protein [Ilumatobacter sp.]
MTDQKNVTPINTNDTASSEAVIDEALGVIDAGAEHDRLSVGIGALQVLNHLARHELGTLGQDEGLVHVADV